MSKPVVGLGVILVNQEGKILVGKRKGSHAPYFSIPGGGLEMGESFEEGAAREIMEETGLSVNPKVIACTNNLETYEDEGFHSISIVLVADAPSEAPIVCEPEKCESWEWVNPRELPEPHFDASRMAIQCYLNGVFYSQNL